MKQRYKLTIEYDGRAYVGMQAQKNGPSIQAALERAAKAYTQQDTPMMPAGRTDAGVHAKAMVVHCDITRGDKPFKVMAALNAYLRPQPIAVLKAEPVREGFHARFDCVRRAYGYRIIARKPHLALDEGFAWRIPQELDAAAMREGAQHLLGKHDFTTFRHLHCQAQSPIRTLERLDVEQNGEDIWIYAEARSFLHSQVRSMVGCLSMVGRGKWTPADMKRVLDARDRTQLGFNAPPGGLFFLRADY